MFVKHIDRYVSRSFLVAFFGILLVIFGLYVAFDLLKRIDELREMGGAEALPSMARYYGNLFPLFIHDTVPTVVMVAAGLTLVKMSKERELLILKANGISIYRVTLPIFFWTLLLTAGLFWLRETVVPTSIRIKELTARQLDRDTGSGLLLKDERHGFKLFVDTYDFSDNSMKRVLLIELHPSRALKRMVEADEGRLSQDGTIYLEKAHMRTFDERGVQVGKAQTPRLARIETTLTRFDFHRAKRESETGKSLFLTLGDLAAKMKQNPGVPYFRVLFHSRFASGLTPFVLLLVGIPFLIGFEHRARSRFLGIVVCIVVAATYYTIMFVCTSMGNTGTIDPRLAGWLPVIIVGPCGVWLFESMRS